MGAHGEHLRPGEGHLVLAEELPDGDRVRRSRGPHRRAPVLRPDLDAPRGRPGLLARVRGPPAGPGAPARLTDGSARAFITWANGHPRGSGLLPCPGAPGPTS